MVCESDTGEVQKLSVSGLLLGTQATVSCGELVDPEDGYFGTDPTVTVEIKVERLTGHRTRSRDMKANSTVKVGYRRPSLITGAEVRTIDGEDGSFESLELCV
jgi:hypothetical protein